MGGFSLIEVLAAISVFAIITVGITPLIVSSIRGTTLARSFTRSKNLVQEAMERIRGFPYFDTGVNRDVLDLYFPNLTASSPTGYSATTKAFTTICTRTSRLPAATGPQACPPLLSDGSSRIPVGHTLTFEAAFVAPSGTSPETFVVQTPTPGYAAGDPALGIPPTQLLRIRIVMSWAQIGRTRTFELVSLIGDRKLSPDKARANATIDFVVEALTSYKRLSDGRLTRLSASSGRSTSDIEIRNLSSASVEAKAGELALTSQENATEAGVRLETVTGASSARITGPPSQSALARIDDTNLDDSINHPDIPLTPAVAFLANGSFVFQSATPAAGVQVVNNLPRAIANFSLDPSAGALMWTDNQADTSNTALRKLDPLAHVMTISKLTGQKLEGSTSAEATATVPTTSRKVEAIAVSRFGELELLVPTFIVGSDRGVIVIQNFISTLTCRSTGSAATSVATGEWEATFKYWADTNDNGLQDGGYVTVVSEAGGTKLKGSTTSTFVDALAQLRTTNPVVYDAVGTTSDVHLFEDTGKIGYLTSLASTPLISVQKTNTLARVSLEQAINIVTAQTDPFNEETQLTVNVGKSSCEASDKRSA